MALVKFYTMLYAIGLITNAWHRLYDGALLNRAVLGVDIASAVLGLCFGLCLGFSALGLFFEKLWAYRLASFTYKVVTLFSFSYLLYSIFANTSSILRDWPALMLAVLVLPVHIVIIRLLDRRLKVIS